MPIEHLNPKDMHSNPAFSQGIILPPGARTLLIGGQNAVDENGQIVGKGDIGAQSVKAVDNLIKVLEAAGGDLDHLVRVAIYIVGDEDLRPGFGAWMERWGKRTKPPVVTGIRVHGLANPDYLIEIEAMAILP
ncbi:RidA family protein [Devosia sp.]|uniref:RidA family protein n=1 Tax=Devosia sp. TaxID=1871048 RepID=UPI003264CD7E